MSTTNQPTATAIPLEVYMRATPMTDTEFRRLLTMMRMGVYDGSEESEWYGPIEMWDTRRVTDMSYVFSNYVPGNAYLPEWPPALLETLDLRAWDTGRVTNMEGMFSRATNFRGDGIGAWDTRMVTDMSRMFVGATSFRCDGVHAWNTRRIRDLMRLFY